MIGNVEARGEIADLRPVIGDHRETEALERGAEILSELFGGK